MAQDPHDAGSSLNATTPDDDRDHHASSSQPRLGRYELHRLLGSGGMGAVFAAFDPELRRVVAVKVLHPLVGGEAAAELRREGQVMARLTHPNVVPIYDVGEAGGTTFVAMAYVKGGTLAEWLAAAPRSVDEIVGVFRQAGRGLAAAHDAGLVHRDFKPGNALVADDGHVMVSDFGLALPVNAPGTPAPFDVPEPLRAVFDSIKMSSSAVGTPAYMSPEQRLGRPLDARADQFSFCVALWYALYGQAPYRGKTGRELLDAALAGKVVATPGPIKVPPPVRAALLRGLRADPEARFPTMHALLAALDAEAWQGRRRLAWAGLAAAGVLAASFALAWWWRGQESLVPPCESLAPRFVAWDEGGAIRKAFLASGVPYAEVSYAAVGRVLGQRQGEWSAMRKDSCLATRVRREQSDAAMDLRAACLERRAGELDAFLALLRQADRAVVDKAVEAAAAVGQVDTCADAAALARRMPLPADPARRQAVQAVESELAAVRASAEAGRAPAALTAAAPLVERARQLGHPPLLAEALYAEGRAAELSARYAEAERAYDEALLAAEAAGDDALRLELEILLTDVVGHNLERDGDGQAHARRAEALLARTGAGPRGEARLARARGQLDWWHGRYAQALTEARRAVELFERSGAAGDELARAYYAVGVIHDDKHDDAEALAAFERAHQFAIDSLGAEHPFTARTWSARGGSLRRLGRYDEAEQALRRGLALQEASGPESVLVGAAHINLGNLYASTERPEKAIEQFARAVAIFEKTTGPGHSHHGLALESLGNNLSRVGRFAEAEKALQQAIEIHRSRVGADHLATATSQRKLGEHHLRIGQPGKAVPYLVEAARALEASLGPDDENLARPHGVLGEAYMQLRRFPEAVTAFERAVATVGDDANDQKRRAEYRFALAEALVAARRDEARAVALARQAREHFAAAGDGAEVARVDAWLKRRPP